MVSVCKPGTGSALHSLILLKTAIVYNCLQTLRKSTHMLSLSKHIGCCSGHLSKLCSTLCLLFAKQGQHIATVVIGGADPDMHLVIAAHAAKLVAPLQELSLSTRLSRLTPGSTQVFATRKWPGVPGPDVNEEEGCRLIVLALSLFHSLFVKEYTRRLTIESSKSATASSSCCVKQCTCQAVQMLTGHACLKTKCRASASIASGGFRSLLLELQTQTAAGNAYMRVNANARTQATC